MVNIFEKYARLWYTNKMQYNTHIRCLGRRDPQNTLDLCLRLHPRLRTLYILNIHSLLTYSIINPNSRLNLEQVVY